MLTASRLMEQSLTIRDATLCVVTSLFFVVAERQLERSIHYIGDVGYLFAESEISPANFVVTLQKQQRLIVL